MRTAFLLSAVLAATPAFAAPSPAPGAAAQHDPVEKRARRVQMLKKLHTMLVLEIGEALELDTAGTIQLASRLEKYNEERIRLRLDNFDAMQELKRIAQGEASGEAAALVRRVAANRVKLAQVDQQELEIVVAGQPPEKVAKIAELVARYPKRMEQLGRGVAERHGAGGPDGRR